MSSSNYTAPEQVCGVARTYVYAIGVLLYELLTGAVPYPAEEAPDALQRKVRSDPPLVRRQRPDVSVGLEALVCHALRRRLAERHASMAALRQDLLHLDQVTLVAAMGPEQTARRGSV